MRTIFYLIQKEFIQITRDKFMSRAIVLMPIIQMIILVYAATFEIKEVQMLIVDRDGSETSIELIRKFSASKFFRIEVRTLSQSQIDESIKRSKFDVAMVIPSGFEKKFQNLQSGEVQLLIDAVNGMAAELSLAYCRAIIADFNAALVIETTGLLSQPASSIKVSTNFWYNPLLDYKIYMAPGILVILITAIGWFMAGMNLVREKETGTIEQINVSPIRKYQFIAGKMIPFLVIGLSDLVFGLILAKLLYQVPIEGSLITLFVFASVYLFAVLGIGLFISTVSNTQQQVLFISFFFVMVFVLMSGLFTSPDNMPRWGQIINWFNPLGYFIRVIRMVLLKGSSLIDIKDEIFLMLVYGLVVNALAIWRYRKVN